MEISLVAAVLDHESRPELGRFGAAFRKGFASSADYVADTLQISVDKARNAITEGHKLFARRGVDLDNIGEPDDDFDHAWPDDED